MKMIDLSMTIQPHWRWKVSRELAGDFKKGDPFQISVIGMPVHAFTHMDTPLHVLPDQITVEEVPLDTLAGPAAVLDLSSVAANQAISPHDLQHAGGHIQPGDIVLIKTGWDLKRDYLTREFWKDAPYLEEAAAAWLSTLDIKAVGFDFPQDYGIRNIPIAPPEEQPTHQLVLKKGIYLIEYLCNLHRIESKRVTFYALPLKIAGAEGGPVRAFATIDA
jgi:kynurenine formamidase